MSDKINDGDYAFPVPDNAFACGMSLRDYFAAKAMAAVIADCTAKEGLETTEDFGTNNAGENQYSSIAADAYAIADAMLAARKAKP